MKRTIIVTVMKLLCLLVPCGVVASPYALEVAPHTEQLSNNSVMMMEQDREGFIWCGTYDGLNRYDGKHVKVFRFEFNNPSSLSGNIISELRCAEPDVMWVLTTMGFDKFSTRKLRCLEHHPDIRGERYTTAADTLGNVFASGFDGQCMYYNRETHEFTRLPIPKWVGVMSPCRIVIAGYNTVWFFPKAEYAYKVQYDFSKGYGEGQAHFSWEKVRMHEAPMGTVFASDTGFFYIDGNGRLYHHNQNTQTVDYIASVSGMVQDYDLISGITRLDDDILVSVVPLGVLRLSAANGYKGEYNYTETGVFHIMHDSRQPIVWVGTDGRGLQRFVEKDSRISTIRSSAVGRLSKPIRTFYTDIDDNLWIGTKGNGLFVISDYQSVTDMDEIPQSRITRIGKTEGLPDDQVFAIKESLVHPGRVWVASYGPGISYFHGKDRTPVNLYGKDIVNIHDIYEQNDTVLWLASPSTGLVRAVLDGKDPEKIVRTDKFMFRKGKYICNEIYSITWDRGDCLYIGCRGGLGIVRFNLNTYEYSFLTTVTNTLPGIGDIICLTYSGDGMLYFGSSAGAGILDCRNPQAPELLKVVTRNEGLANDMIHAIIPDGRGNVWLSTNKGLALYNSGSKSIYSVSEPTGSINEYCDNAGYMSPYDGNVIFGALNGITILKSGMYEKASTEKFNAPVLFTSLEVNGVEDTSGLLCSDDGVLRLAYDQNMIRISFASLDYVNSETINYWYKLEGYDDMWVNAGANADASFKNLPPGEYRLRVRSSTDATAESGVESVLPIVVYHPWYARPWAMVCYALLFVIIVAIILVRYHKVMQRKHREMESTLYKNEQERLHVDRMEFFTNITHELCSPLTMIMAMCDILQKNTDEEKQKKFEPYIESLRCHSRRLNELVEEILEVRNMEEGNFTRLRLQPVLTDYMFERWVSSYDQIAQESGITFISHNDASGLRWNTDISSLGKIVNNLISNALKYTPEGGEIRVSISHPENGNLVIDVYNTGAGIKAANIKTLFDKFVVFNNVERNRYRDMASRHGLGLYICHEMVTKLKGEITCESTEGEYARFTVTLPPLEINSVPPEPAEEVPVLPKVEIESRPMVLVVDDNPDILWLLNDILSEEYTVMRATTAMAAMKQIESQLPSLIITDIMMPDVDGIEFVKMVRNSKYAKHLPVMVLSANMTEDFKMKAYNAGADAYVTKPFSPDFLKVVLSRLLKRKDNDRDYYRSKESSVTIEDGMEISNEGKEFLERVKRVIAENLTDESSLTPSELASALGCDLRTLYRKFKKFTPYTPNDFVKRYRYSYAANLILTTNLSIQEIIYRVGMNNKAAFYSDFKKIYGVTPKVYRDSK